MFHFWQRLRAAWAYGKYAPYVVKADDPNFWTVEDAAWLAALLRSHNGQKFSALLRNYAVRAAVISVTDTKSPTYRKDVAAGCFMLIAAIQAHATVLPQAEQASEQTFPQEQYVPG